MKLIHKWLLSDVPEETREAIRAVAKERKTTIGFALKHIVEVFVKKK